MALLAAGRALAALLGDAGLATAGAGADAAQARRRNLLHPLGDRANFTGLVLGCIEVKFGKKICV